MDDSNMSEKTIETKVIQTINLCRDKTNKDFDNGSRLINQIYRVETLRFGEYNVISKQ